MLVYITHTYVTFLSFHAKQLSHFACFDFYFSALAFPLLFSLIYGSSDPHPISGSRYPFPLCPCTPPTILICGHSKQRKYLHNLNKFMRSSSHFQFAISLPNRTRIVAATPSGTLCVLWLCTIYANILSESREGIGGEGIEAALCLCDCYWPRERSVWSFEEIAIALIEHAGLVGGPN